MKRALDAKEGGTTGCVCVRGHGQTVCVCVCGVREAVVGDVPEGRKR